VNGHTGDARLRTEWAARYASLGTLDIRADVENCRQATFADQEREVFEGGPDYDYDTWITVYWRWDANFRIDDVRTVASETDTDHPGLGPVHTNAVHRE
jgi:hypothetical protein